MRLIGISDSHERNIKASKLEGAKYWGWSAITEKSHLATIEFSASPTLLSARPVARVTPVHVNGCPEPFKGVVERPSGSCVEVDVVEDGNKQDS